MSVNEGSEKGQLMCGGAQSKIKINFEAGLNSIILFSILENQPASFDSNSKLFQSKFLASEYI